MGEKTANLGITNRHGLVQFKMRGKRGAVKAEMTVDPRYVREWILPVLERELADAEAWRSNPVQSERKDDG